MMLENIVGGHSFFSLALAVAVVQLFNDEQIGDRPPLPFELPLNQRIYVKSEQHITRLESLSSVQFQFQRVIMETPMMRMEKKVWKI